MEIRLRHECERRRNPKSEREIEKEKETHFWGRLSSARSFRKVLCNLYPGGAVRRDCDREREKRPFGAGKYWKSSGESRGELSFSFQERYLPTPHARRWLLSLALGGFRCARAPFALAALFASLSCARFETDFQPKLGKIRCVTRVGRPRTCIFRSKTNSEGRDDDNRASFNSSTVKLEASRPSSLGIAPVREL